MAVQMRNMLAGLMGTVWGVNAAMNPIEESMVIPPAGRIISRMTPGDMQKYSALMDPISLLAGVTIWGARVWSIKAYTDTAKRQAAAEAAQRVNVERQSRQPDSTIPVRTPPDPAARTLNGSAMVADTNGTGAATDIAALLPE